MWLIIAEKDKAARRIASILFKDVRKISKNGVNVYYSPSSNAYVIGLKGHIVELDFPKEYNNWKSVSLESLLDARLIRKIKERKVVNLLKELAKYAKVVTVATDYDREGELIGLEAIEVVKSVNPFIKVNRAKFSAITPKDIRQTFSKPTALDINLASAALTRQKIDLIWGATLTRLVSLASGRLGKDFLSVGRVQSPTLRLIVEREKEIRQFKPKRYWEIRIKLRKGNNTFVAEYDRKFEKKEDALAILRKISDFARVVKLERELIKEAKPIPFNTTEFLKEASRFMKPDEAMNIAENLYMAGYISYPRTDNTVYPPTLDLVSIAKQLLNSEFANEAKLVLMQDEIIPSRGKKEAKDHPPIHPTAVASRDKLSRKEWVIYELVVRRFLATLASDAVWEIRKGYLDAGGYLFRFSGKRLVEPGWRAIYIYASAKEVFLPDLKENEVLPITGRELLEKKTKPPSRYSAGELIKLMEKLGLGTKSTRHEILRKLYLRKYVDGDPLKPNAIAFALIEVLKKNAKVITLPDMTAKLEEEMDAIAEGKKKEYEVVEESKEMLRQILQKINREELANDLKNVKEEVPENKIVGKCLKCNGVLMVKKFKNKRFIGCSNYPACTFSIPLPQKGTLRILKKTCRKHGLRIIKVKYKGKNFEIGCPYCNFLEWKVKKASS